MTSYRIKAIHIENERIMEDECNSLIEEIDDAKYKINHILLKIFEHFEEIPEKPSYAIEFMEDALEKLDDIKEFVDEEYFVCQQTFEEMYG